MSRALFSLLLAALLGGTATADSKPKAIDFTLPDLSGKKISLSSFKGKVVIVDFWATWCGPCKKELPALNALVGNYGGKVVVVAVNIDKDKSKAAKFVADNKLDKLVVLLDPEGKDVAGAYSPPTMPTNFVVDKDQLVEFVNVGFKGGDEKKIAGQLDGLTKK